MDRAARDFRGRHRPGGRTHVLQKTEPAALDCPACGRPTAQQRLYAKNGCDILACKECGIGRTVTVGFDPAAYYTDDYFSGGHADGYADYAAAAPVLRREFAATVRFIRRFRVGSRLLELGCAYGFFLDEAKAAGFDVHGVELAAEAAASARARGLDVETGIADAAYLERIGSVDLIVLLDVIEHLEDPHETLAACARHLAAGGIVVVTTGDFGSLLARLAGRSWRLMTPPQHLWFFTRASMQRLAASLGLRLVSFDRPWKTVPLSLIVFQLRRMLGLEPRAPSASRVGLPVNLFDAMRVVMQKPE
jgi:SAM-dependent methyltransferase